MIGVPRAIATILFTAVAVRAAIDSATTPAGQCGEGIFSMAFLILWPAALLLVALAIRDLSRWRRGRALSARDLVLLGCTALGVSAAAVTPFLPGSPREERPAAPRVVDASPIAAALPDLAMSDLERRIHQALAHLQDGPMGYGDGFGQLVEMGPSAFPILKGLVQAHRITDSEQLEMLAQAAGSTRSPQAEPLLLALLAANATTKSDVLLSLAETHSPGAAAHLQAALRSPNRLWKTAAIEGLAQLGEARAIPWLLGVLEEPDAPAVALSRNNPDPHPGSLHGRAANAIDKLTGRAFHGDIPAIKRWLEIEGIRGRLAAEVQRIKAREIPKQDIPAGASAEMVREWRDHCAGVLRDLGETLAESYPQIRDISMTQASDLDDEAGSRSKGLALMLTLKNADSVAEFEAAWSPRPAERTRHSWDIEGEDPPSYMRRWTIHGWLRVMSDIRLGNRRRRIARESLEKCLP